MAPTWLQQPEEKPSYCEPLHWKRHIDIPIGHHLEAWIVWSAAISGASWTIDPARLLSAALDDPRDYALRSLMFPIRLDSKDRLCCAGLFASLVKIAGRVLWVAP